ncbi:MAG: hypothetical protein WCG97_00750 [bacterium]
MQALLNYKEWLEIGLLIGMTIYWSFVFIVIYHLIRFGVGTLPKKIAVIFLAGGIMLSMITILFFAQMFNG